MEYDFWEDLKESIEEIRLGELEEKALFDFIRYTIGNSLPTEKGQITVKRKEDSAFPTFLIEIKGFTIECNSLGKIKFTHKVPGKGIYHLENIGGNGMSIPDSSKLDKYSVSFYSQEEIDQAEKEGKSVYSLELGTKLEKRIEIGDLDGDFERGIDIKTGYKPKQQTSEVKEPKSMSLPREDIIEKIAEGISYHNIFLSHDYGQPILYNFLEQALGTLSKELTPPIRVQVVPPRPFVSSKLLEGAFQIIIKCQEGTIKIDCSPDGLFVCDADMKETGRYVMTNTDEISLISTSKPQKQRVAVRYYDPKSSHEMSTDNMIVTIPAEYYQVIPTEQLGGDFTKCINQLLEKEEAPGRKGR